MTGLCLCRGGANSSSDVEGVNGISSAGLEDKEEDGETHSESRSYFFRDVGVGMGGCGNLKDKSVKDNLKESGEGVSNVDGGCGAGRGEERRESSVGKTRESLTSETRVACLRIALRVRFELPSGLE